VQPASLQPRKTYNTLVSQLFSGVPIKTDEPIDSTMRRKIQKLQEYLQANPAKVPKVCTAGPAASGTHDSLAAGTSSKSHQQRKQSSVQFVSCMQALSPCFLMNDQAACTGPY
jgi:hypothetical protein